MIACAAVLLMGSAIAQTDFARTAEALGKSAVARGGYPWYDAANDDIKPMAPPQETPGWFARFLEVVLRFLGSGARGAGAAYQSLAMLTLALIFGFTVYWIVVNLASIKGLIAKNKTEPDAPIAAPRMEDLRLGLPLVDDLLGEARRLRDLGNLHDAAVYLYAHLLTRLDRRGVVEIAAGKTNRRYQAEVCRRAEPARGDFDTTVRLFEDAFFGRLPISIQRFDAVLEAALRAEKLGEEST